MFDNLDFENLPKCKEEAFVEFEKNIRQEYEGQSRNDREFHADQNGNYYGSYAPEKSYVMAVLACVDEYNLDLELPDIIELSNDEFEKHFGNFKSKVLYATMRFSLRKNRIENGSVGTLIMLEPTYKSEIGKLLETIRKVVNQEVTDTNKKDKIFSKISSLQSEIDRDQTTIDALFGRMIDLSKTVGECADNIEPLIEKIERVKKIFWDNSKKVDLLPKIERPKLITKEETVDTGEEIPF